MMKETEAGRIDFVDTRKSNWKKCGYCGGKHKPRKCPAYGRRCSHCNRLNHFEKCCRLKLDDVESTESDANVEAVKDSKDYLVEALACENNSEEKTEAFTILLMNQTKVKVKLDTGAEVNVLPKRVWEQLRVKPLLERTDRNLKGYGGNYLDVLGVCSINCQHTSMKKKAGIQRLRFYVVETTSKTILGLQSCQTLDLVKILAEVTTGEKEEASIEEKVKKISGKDGDELKRQIKSMYPELFEGLGKIYPEYKMTLKKDAVPVVQPPRKVPATIREKLKNELDRMEKDEVIEKVSEPTDWVSSMAIVEKPDGSLRICLDPRDLNENLKREHYQLPTFEEISMRLTGATLFTKLDANKGYWQIPLDHESSLLTTMNTPFGRYRFKRMPFGIHTAQEVFHKRIQQLFGDIQNVETDIDDFLIWGKDRASHDKCLIKCLERMKTNKITLNINKCSFREPKVTYLGHVISGEGITVDNTKVKAIMEMPQPRNKKDIQRLLGMLNYVGKFLPNISEIATPLREIIKKDVLFSWEAPQQKAFEDIKLLITSTPCLQLYDVNKDVILEVDACKTGLGAVLIQEGRPVAYASRAMTSSQQNYAIIEKELQAVVFACERFHQFIYGKTVTIFSDHKPLESISQKLLAQAPPRLQRMLLRLQKYDIRIRYKPGKEMILADALSRAHLSEVADEIPGEELEAQVHRIMEVWEDEEEIKDIVAATNDDETLKEVRKHINEGWPNRKRLTAATRKFLPYQDELSVINSAIFKGERIVIPEKMISSTLRKLHQSHMGMEKTKLRARTSVFWIGINRDIEDITRSCNACQSTQPKEQKEPLISSRIPMYPWQIVGTDLFEWKNQHFVLVVDYHSRYWEIERIYNQRAATVINKIKAIFARNGSPEEVRSDNGSQYTSSKFANFSKGWNFKHVTSSPEYPQSNGLAEKTVQIAKNLLTRCQMADSDPHLAILEYRNTPVDGFKSPNELLKGRTCRSNIPVKKTKYQVKGYDVKRYQKLREQKQEKQKSYYDKGSKVAKEGNVGDSVRVRSGNGWKRGTIVNRVPLPRSYLVKMENGNIWRRNRRDLRVEPKKTNPHLMNEKETKPLKEDPDSESDDDDDDDNNQNDNLVETQGSDETMSRNSTGSTNGQIRTRYGRIVRKPDFLSYK